MKRTILASLGVLVFMASSCPQGTSAPAGEPSVRQLVAKCIEALGGKEVIGNFKTLRSSAIWPDHGTRPLVVELMRPDFSRNPSIDMVFDGKKAAIRKGDGKSPGPVFIDDNELVDFEVEIAWYIPAFLDYPAEYAGMEESTGRRMYKLLVVLPRGARMTYYLDSSSWLIVKAAAEFTLRGKPYVNERLYCDYRKVDGLLIPHTFTYRGRKQEILEATVTKAEVNVVFPADNFTVPAKTE